MAPAVDPALQVRHPLYTAEECGRRDTSVRTLAQGKVVFDCYLRALATDALAAQREYMRLAASLWLRGEHVNAAPRKERGIVDPLGFD